ncbi:uncharacterized protein PV09_09543 [Verruconis gallopava]|uniref:Uncharacterized protein n=1 Tax=Verruconis gallopava TaxID=253628 RepID=A0A0D1ZW27_9PEZI|nr:uncharacterized protein PV09_09543 [Verruconis gallopava]KIV98687.1 hypothetical protein PV09_09543 [Verruconis gallopava]
MPPSQSSNFRLPSYIFNKALSWPRLPSLFLGLCQIYLNTNDAVARIGAEQLVDGMNLSKEWCDMNLLQAGQEVLKLAYILVQENAGRMDPFSGNKITCYIHSEHDAQLLRELPGASFRTAPKPALRTMPNCDAWQDLGRLPVNISV